MTPHDPRAAEVLREARTWCSDCRRWMPLDAEEDVLDALAAAGLHVVPEGHAVIDGEVVALELNEVVSLRGRLRWDAEIWRARGGAPDTEGRRGADEKEAPK